MKKIVYPILIILSSVIAIIPLLQPGYFSNHEEFFPMFRLYELYRGLQAGYFFPRWGPDWVFGFGYPFFNFYSPLSYYFAAFWHWLGFGLVDSVKIVFGASIILSGLTMYLWAKEFWGREGGLISAVVYMYLPYRLTDIYTRGNLAEAFAFIWLPLILFATHKILQLNNYRITMNGDPPRMDQMTMNNGRRPNDNFRIGYGLLLSVSLAALILTHNLTAIYFLPIMIAYAIHIFIIRAKSYTVSFLRKQESRYRPGFRISACGGLRNDKSFLLVTGYMLLAAGLSAFFWFSALYDTRLVRTQDMIQMWYLPIQFLWSNIGHTEHFDFLKQQFYPVHWILMFVGFLTIAIRYIIYLTKVCHSGTPSSSRGIRNPDKNLDSDLRRNNTEMYFLLAIFSIVMIAILVFFITPLSQPIWEALPKQFHYIQFSWRLLIFVGLFVSFLCGSIMQLFNLSFLRRQESSMDPRFRGDDTWSLVISILLIVWLIASTFPRLQTVYTLNALSDDDITIEKSWNWDKQFGTMGNTAQSEYLPKWVDKNNFQFSIFNFQKKQNNFKEIKKVSLENDGLVTFETFYFPGWQAAIDNTQHPTPNIQPQEGTGFVQVPVPAGEHEVKIWFGSAPWRRWSEMVSIISLIYLIGRISLISPICFLKRKSFQI